MRDIEFIRRTSMGSVELNAIESSLQSDFSAKTELGYRPLYILCCHFPWLMKEELVQHAREP
jgi:hypothetical protein